MNPSRPIVARIFASTLVWLPALLTPSLAKAGDFDVTGVYQRAPGWGAFESFEEPARYVLASDATVCQVPQFEVVSDGTALEGATYARVEASGNCVERFVLFSDGENGTERPPFPNEKGAYRATIWMRHGGTGARFTVRYSEDELVQGRLAPTGRTTSDGWVELASNDIPIDGTRTPLVYLRLSDYASDVGVDFDALELLRTGDFRDQPTCEGIADPVCGPDAICIGGQCELGGLTSPPLPMGELREQMIESMKWKLSLFFGGTKTRKIDLPRALDVLDGLRDAESAWAFWNGFGRAIRELHDWHTAARSSLFEGNGGPRFEACFVEGTGDLSHGVAPRDLRFHDLIVSHVGQTNQRGLQRGDRLVAVDGMHPIEWARGLVDRDWGYHIACDDTSFADFAEGLGGTGGTISRYAKTITVVRCSAATSTCGELETFEVQRLKDEAGGNYIACDNRPGYHLGAASPDAENHYVGGQIFRGRVADTEPEEAIYGMVWDTLYGGGDPNGPVNGALRDAVSEWSETARGVILDHRAGNGGTLDSPEYLTQLVRPREVVAAMVSPMPFAGWDGPVTAQEGLEWFDRFKASGGYTIGGPNHVPDLPVALILHRDGSASDYLPLGMKGAPKVRLFGPGPTAGAFSTYIEFSYWGGHFFQIASGDTLRNNGEPLLGHGVTPDEVVLPRQSDLVVGVDTLHEAALAWVRSELRTL